MFSILHLSSFDFASLQSPSEASERGGCFRAIAVDIADEFDVWDKFEEWEDFDAEGDDSNNDDDDEDEDKDDEDDADEDDDNNDVDELEMIELLSSLFGIFLIQHFAIHINNSMRMRKYNWILNHVPVTLRCHWIL